MILNIGPYGKSREKSPPRFTVSGGTYSYAQSVAPDGIVNWELALLSGTNATITFQRVVDYVDVFLVAGGESGKDPTGYDTQAGFPGKGGGCVTVNGVPVSFQTAYAFSVGGSDANTSIFNQIALTGAGAQGGRPSDYNTGRRAEAGGDGVYAFGAANSLIFSGRKYGAGGGGGGTVSGGNTFWGGDGGASGGGHGGDPHNQTKAETNGAVNTGGGGGGGAYNTLGPYGDGGSGIIIIRNHR